jgi:hypothetical protein
MSNFKSLYDRKGRPINEAQWVDLFQNDDYRVIQEDKCGIYHVSTIWFGCDRNGSTSNLIFETVIFSKKDYSHVNMLCMWRSPTEDIARTIHAIVVSNLKEGCDPQTIEITNPFN